MERRKKKEKKRRKKDKRRDIEEKKEEKEKRKKKKKREEEEETRRRGRTGAGVQNQAWRRENGWYGANQEIFGDSNIARKSQKKIGRAWIAPT